MGRPESTWCRTVEKELWDLNITWSSIKNLVKDWQGQKGFVDALYAPSMKDH